MRKSIQSRISIDDYYEEITPLANFSKRSKRDSEEQMEVTSTTTTPPTNHHALLKPTRSNRNSNVRGRYVKESEYGTGGRRQNEFLVQSVAPWPYFPSEQVSRDENGDPSQKLQPLPSTTLQALAKATAHKGEEEQFANFAKKYLGDPSPERKMTCAERIAMSSGATGGTSASNFMENLDFPSSTWSVKRISKKATSFNEGNGGSLEAKATSSSAPSGRNFYEIFPTGLANGGGVAKTDGGSGGIVASKEEDGLGSFVASLKKHAIQRMLFENSVNVKISSKMDFQ